MATLSATRFNPIIQAMYQRLPKAGKQKKIAIVTCMYRIIPIVRMPNRQQSFPINLAYKKGDLIGQKYEVHGILGQGGFGVVYLVYAREMHAVFALKTFRDEFLADKETRKRFQREAGVWVNLGHYPYLVRAEFVDRVSGRLYIAMEYIAPSADGLNSIEGYLQWRPPDLTQSLRWAVQVCYGMEYAYSKGLRAHRDLKPANIMITQDGTAKIADFGLAGVITDSANIGTSGASSQESKPELSGQTMFGKGFGTPTHMSPEQFENAAGCDELSDIYSFGIVIYQMAAGGHLPYLAPFRKDGSAQALSEFWRAMWLLHRDAPLPRLASPLFPVIKHCLEKLPTKRYQSFTEVRKELEPLLRHQTGEIIIPPKQSELRAVEWINKGNSFQSLARHQEAMRCFDKALQINPRLAIAFNNKANSLDSLGRFEEAIRYFDEALDHDPHLKSAWSNKGITLARSGQLEESIGCFDKALQVDPKFAVALSNKGNSLADLGRHDEAVRCLDEALELDPRLLNAWTNKARSLGILSRYEDAIYCFDKALELDPRFGNAWIGKGASLISLGRNEEAIECLRKAVELDPRNVYAWHNKALAEDHLGQWTQAALSYKQLLTLDAGQLPNQLDHARKRLRELRGSDLRKP